MPAGAVEPGAAQDVDVEVAVVVVVGLHQVEPAEEAGEPRLGGALDEPAVAVVAEVARARAVSKVGGDEVEVAVAVEVVDDHAAGEVQPASPSAGRDVLERAGSGSSRANTAAACGALGGTPSG